MTLFPDFKHDDDIRWVVVHGEQVVLKSKKAFEALTFVEAIEASRQEYYAKYKTRDDEARAKYRDIASKPMAEDEIYMIDIIRNNIRNGQGI